MLKYHNNKTEYSTISAILLNHSTYTFPLLRHSEISLTTEQFCIHSDYFSKVKGLYYYVVPCIYACTTQPLYILHYYQNYYYYYYFHYYYFYNYYTTTTSTTTTTTEPLLLLSHLICTPISITEPVYM